MSHVSEPGFSYQCQVCGAVKPDSEFEDSGYSEVCEACRHEHKWEPDTMVCEGCGIDYYELPV